MTRATGADAAGWARGVAEVLERIAGRVGRVPFRADIVLPLGGSGLHRRDELIDAGRKRMR